MHDGNGVPEHDANDQPRFETVWRYSFVNVWRHFEAQQLTLAEKADAKIARSRKYPVLDDVADLRCYWLQGSMQGGAVHDRLLPMLCHGLQLSSQQVWHILRLAGNVLGDGGEHILIANTLDELSRA